MAMMMMMILPVCRSIVAVVRHELAGQFKQDVDRDATVRSRHTLVGLAQDSVEVVQY